MTVIPFPGAVKPGLKSRTDVLLPNGPTRRVRQKRRLGSVAMRKARDELERHAWAVANNLTWLREIVKANPDPRGVEAMMDDWEDERVGDIGPTLEWLIAFAEIWRRRQMRSHKMSVVPAETLSPPAT